MICQDMDFVYVIEAMRLSILVANKTTSSSIMIEPNYLSRTLGISMMICTCVGSIIYARNPAFVASIANIRMRSYDKLDRTLIYLLINGFALSLATYSIKSAYRSFEEVFTFIIIYIFFLAICIIVHCRYGRILLSIIYMRIDAPSWLTIRKLHCNECSQPLKLIASSHSTLWLLSNYLSPVEQIAAKIGNTQFAIWHCSSCHPLANQNNVHIRGYIVGKHRQRVLICLSCKEATMTETRAYTQLGGLETTVYKCLCCSGETEETTSPVEFDI